MKPILDLLNKLSAMFVKYPWTTIVVGVVLLALSVLYVFYPEVYTVVYTFIVDLYNALFTSTVEA